MTARDRSFPAHLLDGRSAIPQRGMARLVGTELSFTPEGGAPRAWKVGEVTDVQRVAREVHLTLPPLGTNLPSARLTVEHPVFVDLIAASARFAGGDARAWKRGGRRIGLRGWIAIAAVVVPLCYLAYSILLPRLHVFVPVEKEAALGDAIYDAIKTQWEPLDDAEFARVVGSMVEELRNPSLAYDLRVTLVDEDDLNAFALPGGRILIFRGLIAAAPTADALAGVLAHEIAHVEKRHSLKHILRSLGLLQFASSAVGGGLDGFESAETIVELSSGLLILEHSRDHERQADLVAVEKLRAAGRDARGLIQFFEAVREESGDLPDAIHWISTHPLTEKRIERVRRLTQTQRATRPWMSPEEWETFRARYAR